METEEIATYEVKIDFYEVDCGWIKYTIEVNNQKWDGQFSVVYDPILDLKYWLEALALDIHQAAFIVDEEGWLLKFELEKFQGRDYISEKCAISYQQNLFTLSNPEFEDKIFIKQYVNRKQLISAFYNGLIEFSKSEKFSSNDWEFKDLKEVLCEKNNLNEDELMNMLLQKTGNQLADYLFEQSPSYIKYLTKSEDKAYRSRIVGRDKNTFSGNEIEKNDWIIPVDYDNWEEKMKRKFIKLCLQEQQSAYEGTKIKDFHSDIIENYLNPKETEEDDFINSFPPRKVYKWN